MTAKNSAPVAVPSLPRRLCHLTPRLNARTVRGSTAACRPSSSELVDGAEHAHYVSRCHVAGAAEGARFFGKVDAALAAGARPYTSAKWAPVALPTAETTPYAAESLSANAEEV